MPSEFPFDIRFGGGYSHLNPGNSSDVRHIFINDATNGTPEKKGHAMDSRMDLLKNINLLGNSNSYWFMGTRYSFFKGNFKYIGGNEVFDITSNQFGLGGGLESRYNVSDALTLIVTAGLDYYFSAKLKGHDIIYYPDDDNVNVRTNKDTDKKYVYKDANKAVKQPEFMPRLMFGLQWDF